MTPTTRSAGHRSRTPSTTPSVPSTSVRSSASPTDTPQPPRWIGQPYHYEGRTRSAQRGLLAQQAGQISPQMSEPDLQRAHGQYTNVPNNDIGNIGPTTDAVRRGSESSEGSSNGGALLQTLQNRYLLNRDPVDPQTMRNDMVAIINAGEQWRDAGTMQQDLVDGQHDGCLPRREVYAQLHALREQIETMMRAVYGVPPTNCPSGDE